MNHGLAFLVLFLVGWPLYLVTSVITVGMLAYLPTVSFRFRLWAVVSVLTVGLGMTFITSWAVVEVFEWLPRPKDYIPGDWAVLGLSLAIGSQLIVLALMVVTAYLVRRKLVRQYRG